MIPFGLFTKVLHEHETDAEIEIRASGMTPQPKFRLEKDGWVCEAEHWLVRKVLISGKGQYKKDAMAQYEAGIFIERTKWGV